MEIKYPSFFAFFATHFTYSVACQVLAQGLKYKLKKYTATIDLFFIYFMTWLRLLSHLFH